MARGVRRRNAEGRKRSRTGGHHERSHLNLPRIRLGPLPLMAVAVPSSALRNSLNTSHQVRSSPPTHKTEALCFPAPPTPRTGASLGSVAEGL